MWINVIQLILAVILITVVLLQGKSGGLGDVFGGTSSNAYRTKRGAEKVLHNATIAISILFFAISLINILY